MKSDEDIPTTYDLETSILHSFAFVTSSDWINWISTDWINWINHAGYYNNIHTHDMNFKRKTMITSVNYII